jgi:hypothetical protein
MRAVRITRFGGPEVLDVVDLPDPTPGDGEQLFDTSSAGVGPLVLTTPCRPTEVTDRSSGALVPGGARPTRSPTPARSPQRRSSWV